MCKPATLSNGCFRNLQSDRVDHFVLVDELKERKEENERRKRPGNVASRTC